jgi:PAS domain S-box-containing protein
MGTERSEPAERRRREIRGLVGWGLAYVVAHVVGVALTDPERRVAAIWPASGIGLAALLSTRRRRWPVVLAVIGGVALLINVILEHTFAMSLGFLVANTAEFALGAWIVTRACRRDVTFMRVDEVLALTFATIVTNFATALLGAATPWLFAKAPFWPTYWTWLSTNVLGAVLTAPLAIVWTRPREPGQPSRPAETALFALAWAVAVWITTHTTDLQGPFAPHPYMLLCLVPWAAFRLGLRTVTAAMLLLCIAVSSAVLSRKIHHDFDVGSFADAMLQAQIYVGIAAVMGLLLGARTSEARLARAAESKSAEHLALALAAAQMGTWEWDVASGSVHWSDGVARLFGLAQGEFSGGFEAYLALIHPDDRALVATAIERAVEGTTNDYSIEHRIVWPDGSSRWLACRGRVDRDALGKPIRMAGTVADITERQRVVERLRQAQKMEAMGQLAGGVAHDFNNILATIRMQAEVVGRSAAAKERTLVGEIVASTERGASLTQQLLAFARRQVLQPKALDLNRVVSEITTMLGRLLGDGVRMSVTLSSSPLVIRADAGLLGQVLVNLALNARDAMTDGGTLEISTSQTVVADGDDQEAPPGTYAVLRVADDGCGIAPEHMSRLFEPFFTTKPPGKGTGLGLATLFGIVKVHHGFVRVRSELGTGTSFEILLPSSDDAIAEPAAPTPVARPVVEPGTILLVEDEANLRKTTRMLLEMSGYAVLEAANGVDALRLWANHAQSIGLLLTDVTMPEGLDGRELAATLRTDRPDLKVILTSGFNSDLAGREMSDGQRFLMKPYPLPDLLEAVRHALESGASARPCVSE